MLVALHREKSAEVSLPASVLDAVPMAMVVLDRAGAVVAANRAFLGLAKLAADDCAPGTGIAQLADRHPANQALRAVAAALTGTPQGSWGAAVSVYDMAGGLRGVILAQNDMAASAADRGKAAFLASMSHELRTPLNAVIGFADIIKDQMFGPIGSDKYIEYAGEIRRSGHGLLSIINNIIDLSRIEAGQFKLREEDTDLADLVQGCVKRLNETAQAGKVAVKLDLPAGFPLVSVDPRAIQVVLGNILANAVKFTPEGGAVTVSMLRDDEKIEIAVSDTGVGIGPEHMARLGEAFFQADSVLVRSHQGAGLGLALAKSLMALQGGSMHIDSTPGKGTRVGIRLPAGRAAA